MHQSNINKKQKIKLRNEIVNDYIENMETKKSKNPEETNKSKHVDEEDEFDKAEKIYKSSASNHKENDGVQEKKVDPSTLILHYNKITALKLVPSKSQSVTPKKNKSPPGYLYRKENEYLQKQQSFRRCQSKYLEPIVQRFNEHIFNNILEDKTHSNKKTKGEEATTLFSHPTSGKKHLRKIFKRNHPSQSNDNLLQSLYNPQNPYSNIWTNNMLKMGYNSQLRIDKFLNGVPQYKIQRLQKKIHLPFLMNIRVDSSKPSKNNMRHTVDNQIEFPTILQYFNNNNDNTNNNN